MGRDSARITLHKRGTRVNHRFQGVESASELIHSFNNPIVYFDPDIDGVISGLLVCRYLSKIGKPFRWYINSNRSHDWTLPLNQPSKVDVIAVDFMISPSLLEKLCKGNYNIVSMDHHVNAPEYISCSVGSNRGIIINNQYTSEPEDSRYLSGAGVVFETLIQIDPTFDTEENRALVGITLLSDIREIENPLAEDYLYTLYTHKYKGYIKYLFDATVGKDFDFGAPRVDRNFVDFKLSPAINSCLRFNQQDMVVNFMLGRCDLDTSYRGMQQDLVNAILEKLSVVTLPHLKVAYFYETDFMEYSDILSSFVGLVASRLLDGEHSVICYVISTTDRGNYVKRASFRGCINGLDYNGVSKGYFTCLGHKSAFGIKDIKPSKDLFLALSKVYGRLEKDSNYKRTVIGVSNLAFYTNKALKIAENNCYLLSQNKVYLEYLGNSIENKRSGDKYREYWVDGISVMSFDPEKTPSNSYIVPMLSRGYLIYTLE